jgi:NAD(P)-dependent dehydrogenase (short-subunit alcohol dehydrogenase family)
MKRGGGPVLITGTTSGLGYALLAAYHRAGRRVVCVNRREAPELASEFPGALFLVADIANAVTVGLLLQSLHSAGDAPDTVILNAGVNVIDNDQYLNTEVMRDVLETNLFGTLCFVENIQRLRWHGKTIVAISSTSTIVPNSKNMGYYVSKLSLNKLFALFSLSDPANEYKVVVLGPVETRLNRQLPALEGLQAKIFDWLSQSPARAASRCIAFIDSSRRVLLAPMMTQAFYMALKVAVSVFPGFYYKSHVKEIAGAQSDVE